MKHVYYTYLLTILMSMAGATASAHDIEVANSDGKTILYNYNSDGSSVSVAPNFSDKYTGDVVIPETVTYNGKTYSVTSIGGYAFYGCSGLTSVIIPNSVTSIGSDAFVGCTRLTSVTIPNSLTSIGSHAFDSCSRLTSIIWNAKNYPAFSSDSDNPFHSIRTQITKFITGNEVTSIPSYMCYEMSNLKSVTIGNSVTNIGPQAFNRTAWYDNQPDGLVYAGNVAYKYKGTMPANTSITLKEETVGIADEAFLGCTGLTSVTTQNSVASIGNYAFKNCSGLTSVTIGNSVTSIGNGAFNRCSGLTSITWNAKNYPAFSSALSNPFYNIRSQITEFLIGDEVTSIPSYMCYEMSNLKSITIPNSVTSIGSWAFQKCSGLSSVTIGNSVTSIGWKAIDFSYPSSIKCMSNEPPVLDGGLAYESFMIIYVPYGSKAKYEAARYWGKCNIRMLSDCNSDDVVNEIDCSGVANYIMGNAPEEFDAEASDVDVNGTVDVRDYVGIANIITTGSIYGGTSNNAKAAMSKGSAMPATNESDAENVIYVENVSGSKDSQVELSVRMRNASDIRGFQFDLYLPEGVTMANNAKASLSSDRLAAGDAHTLMVNEVTDGAVRFLCSSMNDESFAGGDGEIATLTVNIADNVANGDYDVVVKNALMTETDISKSYEADNIKSTLTVLDQTGVETVTADNERRDGTIYTVGGQLVGKKSTTSQLRKGIYIRNGKKFVK